MDPSWEMYYNPWIPTPSNSDGAELFGLVRVKLAHSFWSERCWSTGGQWRMISWVMVFASTDMGVEPKIGGKPIKLDVENNGKPY